MEVYLDTIKSFAYLFLALGISWLFWNFAEKYASKGLKFVNPVCFLIAVIWSGSGFFFFSPILNILPSLFHPILQLLFEPLSNWDIFLHIWANSFFSNIEWELLKHRSLLFNSVAIPIFLMIISISPKKIYQPILTKYSCTLNSISIGLFVGISSHLFGDIFLSFIPRGDIGFTINGLNQETSLIWLVLNIFLGILIPFFLIRLTSIHYKRRSIQL